MRPVIRSTITITIITCLFFTETKQTQNKTESDTKRYKDIQRHIQTDKHKYHDHAINSMKLSSNSSRQNNLHKKSFKTKHLKRQIAYPDHQKRFELAYSFPESLQYFEASTSLSCFDCFYSTTGDNVMGDESCKDPFIDARVLQCDHSCAKMVMSSDKGVMILRNCMKNCQPIEALNSHTECCKKDYCNNTTTIHPKAPLLLLYLLLLFLYTLN